MKLVSMIDFVLNKEQARTEDEYFKEGFYSDCNARILSQIFNYATFLNQHLNLGMFVPAIEVDGKWEVLEMPTPNISDSGNWNFQARENQYQQAKDRVLFEGFEYSHNNVITLPNKVEFIDLDDEWTIEELTEFAPTLTAKGQQLSGLK